MTLGFVYYHFGLIPVIENDFLDFNCFSQRNQLKILRSDMFMWNMYINFLIGLLLKIVSELKIP